MTLPLPPGHRLDSVWNLRIVSRRLAAVQQSPGISGLNRLFGTFPVPGATFSIFRSEWPWSIARRRQIDNPQQGQRSAGDVSPLRPGLGGKGEKTKAVLKPRTPKARTPILPRT